MYTKMTKREKFGFIVIKPGSAVEPLFRFFRQMNVVGTEKSWDDLEQAALVYTYWNNNHY